MVDQPQDHVADAHPGRDHDVEELEEEGEEVVAEDGRVFPPEHHQPLNDHLLGPGQEHPDAGEHPGHDVDQGRDSAHGSLHEECLCDRAGHQLVAAQHGAAVGRQAVENRSLLGVATEVLVVDDTSVEAVADCQAEDIIDASQNLPCQSNRLQVSRCRIVHGDRFPILFGTGLSSHPKLVYSQNWAS